jgi:hypothetical protein
MRIVSLLVAFCFSFNVMASTGSIQELERVLDDYHYSLSVDWDQKDQKFYEKTTAEFFGKLEKLIKEQGLSKDQLIDLVEKKTNNKSVVNALKMKMSLQEKASSAEELISIVKESSKDIYSQGASWNGQILINASVVLLVAAAIGYAIWWDASHECVQYESQYVCNTYNNCTYGGGYYDPYYGYGQYCYGNTYTTCGYANVCTEYAKK